MSKKEYYHKCGFTEARETRKTWMQELVADNDLRDRLLSVDRSLKTPSLDRVENAVRLRLECLDEEWRVRAAPRRWARLRFHTAMKQQRTLDDIANRLCPDGTNSVVAFGNARFNASMKGQMPGPASKIRRHLIVKKKGRVVLVDEFQTSKKCSWCTQIQGGSVLRNPRMASWKDWMESASTSRMSTSYASAQLAIERGIVM